MSHPSQPNFIWKGPVAYTDALKLQEKTCEEARTTGAVIFGLEHQPSVVTLGIRGTVIDDLRISECELANQKVELIKVRRGGQATIHSAGQLVIYPIIPLRDYKLGVRTYVKLLEQVCLELLTDMGVDAYVSSREPGIYTSAGKLIFFGLQVRRGVSFHGIAINVSNDLSHFNWIRSCGLEKEHFDSLKAQALNLPLQEVFVKWSKKFSQALINTIK